MDDKKRQRLLKTRERLQQAGLYERPDHVRLVCSQCKELNSVRTTNASIYTPEVRASWKCWRCKANPNRKKETMATKTKVHKVTVTSSDNPTPRTKSIKTITSSKGPTVAETWMNILAAAVGKKKTDQAIAEEMRKAVPDGKKYTADDVARHRSIYNNGRFPIQKNTAPKAKLEKYEKEA